MDSQTAAAAAVTLPPLPTSACEKEERIPVSSNLRSFPLPLPRPQISDHEPAFLEAIRHLRVSVPRAPQCSLLTLTYPRPVLFRHNTGTRPPEPVGHIHERTARFGLAPGPPLLPFAFVGAGVGFDLDAPVIAEEGSEGALIGVGVIGSTGFEG